MAVRDTGIGIAEEDLEKVMTPFGQVTPAYNAKEGFGLGLSLTNKLAQALGGKLATDLHSDPEIALPRLYSPPTARRSER